MPEVELIEQEVTRVAGFREQVAMADLPDAFAKYLPAAWQALTEAGVTELGPPSAVYHAMDKSTCDLTIGMELVGGAEAPEGMSVAEVAAGPAAKLDFYGPYEQIREGFAVIGEWCTANNRQPNGSSRERYITDPQAEPDQSKWLTELYLPVE